MYTIDETKRTVTVNNITYHGLESNSGYVISIHAGADCEISISNDGNISINTLGNITITAEPEVDINDAPYNPTEIKEDYFFLSDDNREMKTEDYIFPPTTEGRGSKVEKLPEPEIGNWAAYMEYFSKKLLSTMMVPASYLDLGK